jgi:peptidoglycan-associated lipoprotein
MKRWTLLAGVALALVASGCATKKYTRETVESETKPIHSRMDEIQGQVEKSQSRIDQVDAEGKQTQQQVAQVSKTAQDALDRADKAGKLAEGKLLYEKVLTDEKAHFPVDSSKISDEAAAALDEFAQRLKAENKNVYLEIQGHTDATGSESYNEKLGLQRAEAVRNYLNMKHQIPLHRMNVISYGESEPIADNKTREGRSQNRRVTIVVLA